MPSTSPTLPRWMISGSPAPMPCTPSPLERGSLAWVKRYVNLVPASVGHGYSSVLVLVYDVV